MTQFRSQTKIVERTVLPPFFPYISTDSVDFGHAVDGYKRIDVDKLRKLISIKPATKIDEICTGEGENAKFDISFQIRVAQCTSGIFDRLQAFQFHVKRKVLKYDSISDVKNAAASDGDNCNILASNLIQPQTSQFQDKKAPIAMPFDAEHVGQIFSANSLPGTSCAALILPYKSFPLTDMINLNKPDKMSQLKLGVEDVQLVKEIVAATPRPVFVQELAQRFIDEVLQCGKIRSSVRIFTAFSRIGRDFVGIHWAYDRNDWMELSCSSNGVSAFMKTKCEQITEVHKNPEKLATGIGKLMRYLEQKGACKSRTLYLATKPTEEDFFKDILRWLRRETPIKMFTTGDLRAYIRKYREGWVKMWEKGRRREGFCCF